MTIQLRSKTSILGLAIAMIAVLVLSACATGDDSTNTDSQESTDSTSSSISSQPIASGDGVNDDGATVPVDLTATPKIDPPEIAVTTKEPVEPGSIEEKVLAVLEKQVTTTNTLDYKGFLETCPPGGHTTEEKIEYIFTEFGGEFGYDIPGFSIEGYNARGVEFRIYSDEVAQTTFDIFNYDQWVASGASRTWINIDGEWYSDGLTCLGVR